MCSRFNLSAYVIKKGDPDAGVIFIHINKLNGEHNIYSQIRTITGQINWTKTNRGTPLNENDADSYLEKQKQYDPDLWILEIEDPEEKYQFDGIVS
jgi:GMP synthase (glutamine-hydrolysing)